MCAHWSSRGRFSTGKARLNLNSFELTQDVFAATYTGLQPVSLWSDLRRQAVFGYSRAPLASSVVGVAFKWPSCDTHSSPFFSSSFRDDCDQTMLITRQSRFATSTTNNQQPTMTLRSHFGSSPWPLVAQLEPVVSALSSDPLVQGHTCCPARRLS